MAFKNCICLKKKISLNLSTEVRVFPNMPILYRNIFKPSTQKTRPRFRYSAVLYLAINQLYQIHNNAANILAYFNTIIVPAFAIAITLFSAGL